MSGVVLRIATPADRALLESWGRNPYVRAAFGDDDPPDWETDLAETDPAIERLIAEHSGRPLGFLEICDPAREATHYWGGIEDGLRAVDIWIGEERDLGRGLGGEMMRLALARCFGDAGVSAVVIDPVASNGRAIRFYERLDFAFQEYRIFERMKCAIMRLDRNAWENGCSCRSST